jgi:ketosteroid isomerase-like protein
MADEAAAVDLVDLARRTVDAQNANDIDGLLGFYAADAVWDSGSSGLAGERFEGSAAIRGFFEEWFGAFDEMRLEADEIREVGNGVVLSEFVQHGKPHQSEVAMEFRLATVSVWVDGLIQENRIYTDIEEARVTAESLAGEHD